MVAIERARVLAGAVPFSAGNVNDTYRGMVLLGGGARRHGIIKDLNLEQLVNELLATILGKELGLPLPDAFLGIVPNGILAVSKLRLADGSGHLVFVSGDVGTPNLAQQVTGKGSAAALALINLLRQWNKLGDLYAFDAWIANTDRHPGNLLIEGPSNIWMIDHGHAFTGPDWKPKDLDPVAEYRNALYGWLTNYLSPTDKSDKGKDVGVFATKIARVGIPQAMNDSLVPLLLKPEVAEAIKDFLMQRVQYVPNQAKKALGMPVLVP